MNALTITQVESFLLTEEINARKKLRGSCAGGYQYQCGYDDCEAKWLPVTRQLLTIAKEALGTGSPS